MSSIPEGKRCSKCNTWYPLNSYSKDKSKPDGRRPDCSLCLRAYVVANQEAIKVRRRVYYENNKETILLRDKSYRDANKDKIAPRRHAYAMRTREQKRIYNIQYQGSHQEEIKAQKRKYIKENLEKIREAWRTYDLANTDKKRSYIRQWRKANPDKLRQYTHVRRALERAANGAFTASEWQALEEHYNYTCLRCGRSEPEIKLTADHVIPLARGGSNDIGNIQPLCLICNLQKHTDSTDYRP